MQMVYAEPATNLPASGTVSYAMIGATKPTIRDGSLAPGSISGSAAVAFGSVAKIGLDLQVSIGGHAYAVATTGGVSAPASRDRERVGWGKSVSVSCDPGGGRGIKKKKKDKNL